MNNMKLLYSSILVVLTHEEVLFFCKFFWPQINNTLANCYINSLNFIAMFCKSKGGGIFNWMILLHPNYPHFIRPQDHEHLKANQMLWKDQPVIGLVQGFFLVVFPQTLVNLFSETLSLDRKSLSLAKRLKKALT